MVKCFVLLFLMLDNKLNIDVLLWNPSVTFLLYSYLGSTNFHYYNRICLDSCNYTCRGMHI